MGLDTPTPTPTLASPPISFSEILLPPTLPPSLTAPPSLPLPTHIQEIFDNWSCETLLSILPSSLPTSAIDITSLSNPLYLALHELSCLTVHQRERAHSLINTYFQCRVRERSSSGRAVGRTGSGKMDVSLEVSDVEQAIKSVRKMAKGLDRRGEAGACAKRKHSIQQEMLEDKEEEEDNEEEEKGQEGGREVKQSRLGMDQDAVDSPLISLPSLSPDGTLLPTLDRHANLLPPIQSTMTMATGRQKRIVRLTPIDTIMTNNVSPSIALYSPQIMIHPISTMDSTLYNSNPSVSNTRPVSQTPGLHGNVGYGSENFASMTMQGGMGPGQIFVNSAVHPAVQAAQRATHEFNVRRMELGDAEQWYTDNRRRFVDAKRKMEGAVKRAKGYR